MTKLSKKVCLLGDFAVGKTSLVRRFVYDLFDDKYLSTIGVKVSRKTMTVTGANGATELTMMLWDLAGSEEFDGVRASYLRGASGAVLVCDLTRADTLANLERYVNGLLQHRSETRLVLAANKADLTEGIEISPAQVEEMAAKMGISFYFTSAKTGETVETVETMFRELGQLLLA
ncbi:MAG: Rab family GTPase [Anaerolineae bacterium]